MAFRGFNKNQFHKDIVSEIREMKEQQHFVLKKKNKAKKKKNRNNIIENLDTKRAKRSAADTEKTSLLSNKYGSPEWPRFADNRKMGEKFIKSDAFLKSFEWRRVRMLALSSASGRCECCGASAKDGVQIHVDHVRPRKHFPELALEVSNLQILCEDCNHGKGNDFMIHWKSI